jgi:hypothetical protein
MANETIIPVLEQQVNCYERLMKLAELQHEHVQQNQIEGLLEVLQRRQTVLDELTGLEQALSPAKRQWAAHVAALPEEDRPRAEQLVAQTRELLERITTADRNDALVLQQRQLNVGRQISQARAAAQVNRNYAAAAYGAPRARVDLGG